MWERTRSISAKLFEVFSNLPQENATSIAMQSDDSSYMPIMTYHTTSAFIA